MAVCHCHDLRTFAPLGFSHPLAPFLAMTKVPSMKHSVKSRLPRSCRSFTNALNDDRSAVSSRFYIPGLLSY